MSVTSVTARVTGHGTAPRIRTTVGQPHLSAGGKRDTIKMFKVRLRWFGTDLVKQEYLCYLSRDVNVLYIK